MHLNLPHNKYVSILGIFLSLYFSYNRDKQYKNKLFWVILIMIFSDLVSHGISIATNMAISPLLTLLFSTSSHDLTKKLLIYLC